LVNFFDCKAEEIRFYLLIVENPLSHFESTKVFLDNLYCFFSIGVLLHLSTFLDPLLFLLLQLLYLLQLLGQQGALNSLSASLIRLDNGDSRLKIILEAEAVDEILLFGQTIVKKLHLKFFNDLISNFFLCTLLISKESGAMNFQDIRSQV